MEHIPTLGFSSLHFVEDMYIMSSPLMAEAPTTADYREPSREVQSIVNAAVATGPILPIKPPSLNATWSTEFDGPIVKCKNVTNSHRREIEDNVKLAMRQGTEYCTTYGFLAWTSTVPFAKSGNASYALQPASFIGDTARLAILYLAAMPAMLSATEQTGYAELDACAPGAVGMFAESTMLQCELRQARYLSNFHYRDGEQSILTSAISIDDSPLRTVTSVYTRCFDYPDCYLANFSNGGSALSPEALLTTLSYQSIMEAYNTRLTGSVYGNADTAQEVFNTGILSTTLQRTLELQFLSMPPPSVALSNEGSLKHYLSSETSGHLCGVVNTVPTAAPGVLVDTIEELFQNVTMSMMSSDILQ